MQVYFFDYTKADEPKLILSNIVSNIITSQHAFLHTD